MINKYPEYFFNFSGSTKESVKVIGHDKSGWVGGNLIRTRLLDNLDRLALQILSGEIDKPVCVYLVGGPGNGKTEAAAYFLKKLYEGRLPQFEVIAGHKLFKQSVTSAIEGVVVVEDATELGKDVLKSEVIEFALRGNCRSHMQRYIYLCCINRGVLADAINLRDAECIATEFISALSDVVAVGSTSSNMWPLKGNPRFGADVFASCVENVYVWPMDAESLVDANLYNGDISQTPGYRLFNELISGTDVSACECCEGNDICPFYENLVAMKRGTGISNIVYCLHAFEIVTGNKILFRDLLSVANVLFVDSEESYNIPKGDRSVRVSPCDWTAYHRKVLVSGSEVDRLASAFRLAARRYNQILFGDYSEFATKDIVRLRSVLKKFSDVEEFKKVERLLKAIIDSHTVKKNTTRVWQLVHRDLCKRMDVALEESIDKLERIEMGFCSSTKIGSAVAKREGASSGTLLAVLEQLIACEEGLGNHAFDVSTDRGDASRKCLQILQVLGSRLSKREVGGLMPAVYTNDDITMYERICFRDDVATEELNYVRRPLKKVLSLGDKFSAHVLQSIGQTQISPKYVFNITADNKCGIKVVKSKTLPISLNAPVDPTPRVEIQFSYGDGERHNVSIPLTFSLFYALRKIREGLSVASISEQTFVSLNLLSSKLMGIITHYAEEPKFGFPGGGQFVWLGNSLSREDAE